MGFRVGTAAAAAAAATMTLKERKEEDSGSQFFKLWSLKKIMDADSFLEIIL